MTEKETITDRNKSFAERKWEELTKHELSIAPGTVVLTSSEPSFSDIPLDWYFTNFWRRLPKPDDQSFTGSRYLLPAAQVSEAIAFGRCRPTAPALCLWHAAIEDRGYCAVHLMVPTGSTTVFYHLFGANYRGRAPAFITFLTFNVSRENLLEQARQASGCPEEWSLSYPTLKQVTPNLNNPKTSRDLVAILEETGIAPR